MTEPREARKDEPNSRSRIRRINATKGRPINEDIPAVPRSDEPRTLVVKAIDALEQDMDRPGAVEYLKQALRALAASPAPAEPPLVFNDGTPLFPSAPIGDGLLQLVNEQAEDEGLWFVAVTAPEAYLQQELRRLHAAIERALSSSARDDGLDVARLAQALRWVDVLEGFAWEDQAPEGWRHRKLAEDIAAEYRRLSPSEPTAPKDAI